MQKLSCVCLLIVLCAAPYASAYSGGRALKQGGARASSSASASSTEGGSASANAGATSTGGTATAVAEATSEAFTEVENSFVTFYEKYLIDVELGDGSDPDFCANVYELIEIDLIAVARVAATAYTSALADVNVEGEGQACADASASASAQAEGFAQIIVDALVRIQNGPDVAEAEAAVDVFIPVFVTAFSESFASACAGSNSAAFAFQETFAEAVAYPIAGVLVFLEAGIDCQGTFAGAVGESFAELEQSTIVDTVSIADAEGDAVADAFGSGSATVSTVCRGRYSVCCRSTFNSANSCDCTISSRGRGLCNAERTSSNPTEWYDEEADVRCIC